MTAKKKAMYLCIDHVAVGKTLASITEIVKHLGPECKIEITSSDYLKLKDEYNTLANAARNLAEDCGCISPWRIDVLNLVRPEQSQAENGGRG